MTRLLTTLLLFSLWSGPLSAQEAAESPQPSEPAAAGQPPSSGTAAAANPESPDTPEAFVPPEIPEDVKREIEALKKKFQELKAELAAALLAQRDVQIRYLNMERRTPADKKKYNEARLKSRELMDEVYTAALNLVRYEIDQEAATYLVTMLQHRFETDIYDEETMEGAARLIDGGSKLLYLFLTAARSAIVNGETELAERLYEVLGEDEVKEIDRALYANLEAHQENFDKEQAILEKEAAEDNLPRVLIKTTQGDVVVELFLNQAPSTVSNFIGLVEEGYYDGLDFHQVIDHLMAMTGDAAGDGSGNTGFMLMDENDREDARKALRGSLLMAKVPIGETGKFIPHSASSQFLILLLPVVTATDQQTVFGRVIEGMDVVSQLRRVDPSKKKEKTKMELPPDSIIEATVIRRPEVLPEPVYSRKPN